MGTIHYSEPELKPSNIEKMRIWKSRKQDLDPYIDIPYPEQVLNGLKYAHFEHISQGSDLSKNGAFWMDFSQISGTMCDF